VSRMLLVLSKHMPRVIPGFDLKITLLLDLLQKESIRRNDLSAAETPAVFQDPCRSAAFEPPRGAPGAFGSYSRTAACGNGTFRPERRVLRNSGSLIATPTPNNQVERLTEAKTAGSELLITACPKCMIHLTCAIRDRRRQGAGSWRIPRSDVRSGDQIAWYGDRKEAKRQSKNLLAKEEVNI